MPTRVVGMSFSTNDLAQDAGIAGEAPHPHLVAHHEDRRRAGPRVVGQERPAEGRRNAEEAEVVDRHQAAVELLRAFLGGVEHVLAGPADHLLKGLDLLLVVEEFRHLEAGAASRSVRVASLIWNATARSSVWPGNGSSRMFWIALKMVVADPMPSRGSGLATTANAGCLRSPRIAVAQVLPDDLHAP